MVKFTMSGIQSNSARCGVKRSRKIKTHNEEKNVTNQINPELKL